MRAALRCIPVCGPGRVCCATARGPRRSGAISRWPTCSPSTPASASASSCCRDTRRPTRSATSARAYCRWCANSAPGELGPQPRRDDLEAILVEDGALTPDTVLGHVEHPVQAHPGGPAVVVPVARPDPDPLVVVGVV